jgi:hypothetical protein
MDKLENEKYLLNEAEKTAIEKFIYCYERFYNKNFFANFHLYSNENLKGEENTEIMKGFEALPFVKNIKKILNEFVKLIQEYDFINDKVYKILLPEKERKLLFDLYRYFLNK